MKYNSKKILFSIDLEEFDIPEEYGEQVPLKQKLETSLEGLKKLEALLDKHNVRCTIFTTAFWASHYPQHIRALSEKHEIASHTYYHNSFKTEDLATSRKVLNEICGQEIAGIRMPRMSDISSEDVKAAGYTYDSSLHPTWLPGRYNNFDKPRTLFNNKHTWELPASVTPVLRIPIFWLSLKNFPLWFYQMLCKRILNHDGYIVFYVHPWEFTNLSPYNLPKMVKRVDNDRLINKLDKLFSYLSKQGDFITHRELIPQQ
ncbi:MAG: polysaccharide deacetylase family protein [Bacteroidetes bacterium]|nr:polysaccharide deacetylase family protein [Bacteroidota bacterium]